MFIIMKSVPKLQQVDKIEEPDRKVMMDGHGEFTPTEESRQIFKLSSQIMSPSGDKLSVVWDINDFTPERGKKYLIFDGRP